MKTKGFTLVELLITVLILGILSAIGFTVYGPSQVVSRDARRKNDLRALATALELYKQANGRYPCPPAAGWALSTTTSTNWIEDKDLRPGVSSCDTTKGPLKSPDHINQMPIDPSSNGGDPTTGGKGYAYGFKSGLTGGSCPATPAGNYYVLITTLENDKDKDTDGNRTSRYVYCDSGTDYIFTSNTKGYAIVNP